MTPAQVEAHYQVCRPPGLETADGVDRALDWLTESEQRSVIAHMASARPAGPEPGAEMLERALRWASVVRSATSGLNATAKAALRDAGVSQAGWARANYSADASWSGDACSFPDERCIGYHHIAPDDCGWLPTLLGDYVDQARGAAGFHVFTEIRPQRKEGRS